jgi:hypothetical protein
MARTVSQNQSNPISGAYTPSIGPTSDVGRSNETTDGTADGGMSIGFFYHEPVAPRRPRSPRLNPFS